MRALFRNEDPIYRQSSRQVAVSLFPYGAAARDVVNRQVVCGTFALTREPTTVRLWAR
jgi:hypothetical protein